MNQIQRSKRIVHNQNLLAEQLEVIKLKGIVLEQNDLPKEQYEKLVNLIFTNIDLFATGMHDFVGTDIVKMEIDTISPDPRNATGYGKASSRDVICRYC